jgi:hypothetical protein
LIAGDDADAKTASQRRSQLGSRRGRCREPEPGARTGSSRSAADRGRREDRLDRRFRRRPLAPSNATMRCPLLAVGRERVTCIRPSR